MVVDFIIYLVQKKIKNRNKNKNKNFILLHFDTFVAIVFLLTKKGSKRVYIKNGSSGK